MPHMNASDLEISVNDDLVRLLQDLTEALRKSREEKEELQRTLGRLTAEVEELKADAVHAKELD